MTEQTIYSLLAACLGFISALFFGAGSAFTSKTKMVALSKTCWGFNKEFAAATVSQSTQYAIGAMLLVASFCFQVQATLATTAIPQSQCPIVGSPLIFVSSALLAIGIPALFICMLLTKFRQQQVIKQLQKEAA